MAVDTEILELDAHTRHLAAEIAATLQMGIFKAIKAGSTPEDVEALALMATFLVTLAVAREICDLNDLLYVLYSCWDMEELVPNTLIHEVYNGMEIH